MPLLDLRGPLLSGGLGLMISSIHWRKCTSIRRAYMLEDVWMGNCSWDEKDEKSAVSGRQLGCGRNAQLPTTILTTCYVSTDTVRSSEKHR